MTQLPLHLLPFHWALLRDFQQEVVVVELLCEEAQQSVHQYSLFQSETALLMILYEIEF